MNIDMGKDIWYRYKYGYGCGASVWVLGICMSLNMGGFGGIWFLLIAMGMGLKYVALVCDLYSKCNFVYVFVKGDGADLH